MNWNSHRIEEAVADCYKVSKAVAENQATVKGHEARIKAISSAWASKLILERKVSQVCRRLFLIVLYISILMLTELWFVIHNLILLSSYVDQAILWCFSDLQFSSYSSWCISSTSISPNWWLSCLFLGNLAAELDVQVCSISRIWNSRDLLSLNCTSFSSFVDFEVLFKAPKFRISSGIFRCFEVMV